jgi:hypothetical protein
MKKRTLYAHFPAIALLCIALSSPLMAQRDGYSGAPINYMTTEVNDRVANLSRKLETGETQLEYDEEHGYLKAVLKALEVPVSSQTLVFSKTSLQLRRITPRRPRALYFNEDVYVGFCQHGDVLEFAATDARQGATFYTLDQSRLEAPKIIRDRGQCLTCHSSSRTQDVPGYLIRSVYANAAGQPEFGSGTFTTDHTSPLKQRWGGWYVTGTHGDMRHMGNAIFNKREHDVDREAHANIRSLEELVSTTPYLSKHSDIIALMVMEHQTQMHNAIAWANYETRRAIHQSHVMNEALDRAPEFISESSERRMDRSADRVLEYMLFCDEFPLTSPVEGTSDYAKEFQARGIRDSKGRSLRDFDLKTRMFRYPCSYMIYSEAFDGLPDEVRSRVFEKLARILRGESESDQYAHLTERDCRDVLQILQETKPEFAAIQQSEMP